MTCITEVETTCSKVNQTNEHGDEHTILVILGKLVVDASTNLSWRVVMLSHSTEQADNLCHKERSRNTLTRYVTNSEVEMIFLHEIVIEVTSYLLSRSH